MYEFSDQNLDPESVSPHSFIYSYKMERINGEGILLGILLNSFMVLMINVAVFNNSGTGIWNAHTGKKAKLLDILLVSKQLPPAYTVEAKFWSCIFQSFCDLPFQAVHFTMKWLLSGGF